MFVRPKSGPQDAGRASHGARMRNSEWHKSPVRMNVELDAEMTEPMECPSGRASPCTKLCRSVT